MSFLGFRKFVDCLDLIVYLCIFFDDLVNIFEVDLIVILMDYDFDLVIFVFEGDLEYGEYFSSECIICYQMDGGDDGILFIVLWLEEDFVVVMYVYKNKK